MEISMELIPWNCQFTTFCNQLKSRSSDGFQDEKMDDIEDSADCLNTNDGKQTHTVKEKNTYLAKICSREFLKTFLIGQLLSVLLCGTGVTSGLLQQHGLNTPTAQCFLNYILLGIIYGSYLACRKQNERPILYIIKTQGWKYFLLAFIDVEANFLVVKAYSYTTVTSVQILDSFTIPSVIILSFLILRVKYGFLHVAGALVCLLGIGGLILSDVLVKNQVNDSTNDQRVLGDILCICGAVLYSISNVGEEYVVKTYARVEFLGMIGIFGSFISGIQVIIVERNGFDHVDFWTMEIFVFSFSIRGDIYTFLESSEVLPWLLYAICLFSLYSCMTIGIQYSSATAINLAILSADFYALLVGIFVFNYTFHVLYFIAMIFIIGGIILYSLKPTESRDPIPDSIEEDFG